MCIRTKEVSAIVLLCLLAGIAVLPSAAAQNDRNDKKEAQLRTIHGSVLDHEDNPIVSSIVYLKNLRTESIKTYIADDSGHYRFSGLDPNADYEIYAEKDGTPSSHRTVSSFDSRKDVEIILHIEVKKK